MTHYLKTTSFFSALFLVAASAIAQRVEVLDPTDEWVTDRGDFLSASEERSLAQRLAGYADTTSTQIVVVTVQNLGGYAASEYAVELGRKWGVGQTGQDNGVVILLSREERDVFIATGYGMEGSITDALAGLIVRNVMIPRFREGDFYGGLIEASDMLIQAAAGEFTAEDIPERGGDRGSPLPYMNIIFFIAFIVYVIVSRAGRNRGGGQGGRRGRYDGDSILPIILWSALGASHRGGGGFGGGGFGGFGGGGFGGGGGSFGGGGAGGSW